MSKDYKVIEEDFRDKRVDTDISSQERTQREKELERWDQDQAREMAKQDGFELTAAHFEVLEAMRNHYLRNGPAKHARELDNMLDEQFDVKGGRKYLHELFPEGPVAQGMRLAGLPVPADAEDESFGTAR